MSDETPPQSPSPPQLRIVRSGSSGEAGARPNGDAVAPAGQFAPGAFARIFDLTDRVALVVGSGGLGTGIAAGLADFGARVAIADLDLDAAKRVAAMCVRPGKPGPIAANMDVTRPEVITAAVKAVEETAGRIDILVNAAGIQIRKPALDVTPSDWKRIIDINLAGVFFVTQAVGRGMVERGYGRVLTIGSVSSLLGHPEHAPYAASKGGVAIMTKALATEWAQRGVTVNAIGPAYTETALTQDILAKPGAREEVLATIPMGRLGTPEDLVGAAVYLCSDAASFVTGQTLYIDGGRTAD